MCSYEMPINERTPVSLGLILLAVALFLAPAALGTRSHELLDDCPELTIDCPDKLPESGETYLIKARVEGAGATQKLSYKWSVSSGEIVDGQGTSTLQVRFTKPFESVTATVEVEGLPTNCEKIVSCTLVVCMSLTNSD